MSTASTQVCSFSLGYAASLKIYMAFLRLPSDSNCNAREEEWPYHPSRPFAHCSVFPRLHDECWSATPLEFDGCPHAQGSATHSGPQCRDRMVDRTYETAISHCLQNISSSRSRTPFTCSVHGRLGQCRPRNISCPVHNTRLGRNTSDDV